MGGRHVRARADHCGPLRTTADGRAQDARRREKHGRGSSLEGVVNNGRAAAREDEATEQLRSNAACPQARRECRRGGGLVACARPREPNLVHGRNLALRRRIGP
eukprot:scaffold19374_cov69-Phaeocystis_antarctica.AAC.1